MHAFPSQNLPQSSSVFFSPSLSCFLLLLRLGSCTTSQPIFQIDTDTWKTSNLSKALQPRWDPGNSQHTTFSTPRPRLSRRFHPPRSPFAQPRPNYPVDGAWKGVLTLYCPETLLGPKPGVDLEEALKDGQNEDDLARTARPRSDPLKMIHRDPKTRAPHLTCCSCSVRKLTSCFRLSPIHWDFTSPAPTDQLSGPWDQMGGDSSQYTSRRQHLPPLLPAPGRYEWRLLRRALRPWPFVPWPRSH